MNRHVAALSEMQTGCDRIAIPDSICRTLFY